ncbi:MAG: GNAT family N-acetyltransferase, partial [Desulfoferrobacter sp.]
PQQWELAHIFSDDVKVLFRPSKLTDERALKGFFYSLPRDESYVRFLATMKVFPHYDIQKLLEVDYYKKMNIVGIVGDMEVERIISIARYVLDEESMTAELDFAVHPAYARKGIATFLIHHLAEIAKHNCIRMLKAYISPGNEKVFGVFQKLGYLVESSLVNGVYEIRVRFEPARACMMD